MDEALAKVVRERAGYTCEYCRLPQAFYQTPFEIDHIIAKQHGGPTTFSNLALSCLHCNGHKGPNIAGLDPKTRKLTGLFNPRRHRWRKHFRWDGPYLVGRTAVGRATVVVLALNDSTAVQARAQLIAEGVFPPSEG
jgi:5-methylcytosine-specific restriction endonuclease McrA